MSGDSSTVVMFSGPSWSKCHTTAQPQATFEPRALPGLVCEGVAIPNGKLEAIEEPDQHWRVTTKSEERRHSTRTTTKTVLREGTQPQPNLRHHPIQIDGRCARLNPRRSGSNGFAKVMRTVFAGPQRCESELCSFTPPVGQNPVPLVNIKIGGKWMFIHLNMEPKVLPHAPNLQTSDRRSRAFAALAEAHAALHPRQICLGARAEGAWLKVFFLSLKRTTKGQTQYFWGPSF